MVKATEDVWGYDDAAKSKKQACLDFLYDKKNGTVFGRTGKSWALITLFYLIYYSLLAGWWIGLLYAFFATTSEHHPTWIAGNGIIGNNPGLGFRPHPSDVEKDNSLLWFKDDNETLGYWTKTTDKFLQPYRDVKGENIVECADGETAPEDKACHFDIADLDEFCATDNNYGYDSSSPCVFLKLNKIYEWIPKTYEKEEDFQSKMPDDLKELIKASGFASRVWLWCEGQNPADKETIGTPEYFPYNGFSTKYYPFKRIEGYRQPLVAIKFTGLQPYTVVNVECKLWWPEVSHSVMDRLGMVRFQMLVDFEA